MRNMALIQVQDYEMGLFSVFIRFEGVKIEVVIDEETLDSMMKQAHRTKASVLRWRLNNSSDDIVYGDPDD